MGDERLLVQVRTAFYAVPGGFPIVISHAGECGNQPRDEELIRCVRGANPKVMTELIAASKAAMAVMGCLAGSSAKTDPASDPSALRPDASDASPASHASCAS